MSIDAGKEAGGQVGRQAAAPFSFSYAPRVDSQGEN